jgi:Tol biopolymer transport system component
MVTTQITHQQDDLNGVGSPKWSPHGDQVMFQDEADGHTETVIIRPDGTLEWRSPTRAYYSRAADWSPDGKWNRL